MDFLGKVEEKYECSGICDQMSVYYFSNINEGIPKTSCWTGLKKEIFWNTFG